MIASSEIKFDETTVTGFSAKDRMPTVNRIEMPLINIGCTIQRRLRKKKNSRVRLLNEVSAGSILQMLCLCVSAAAR